MAAEIICLCHLAAPPLFPDDWRWLPCQLFGSWKSLIGFFNPAAATTEKAHEKHITMVTHFSSFFKTPKKKNASLARRKTRWWRFPWRSTPQCLVWPRPASCATWDWLHQWTGRSRWLTRLRYGSTFFVSGWLMTSAFHPAGRRSHSFARLRVSTGPGICRKRGSFWRSEIKPLKGHNLIM